MYLHSLNFINILIVLKQLKILYKSGTLKLNSNKVEKLKKYLDKKKILDLASTGVNLNKVPD